MKAALAARDGYDDLRFGMAEVRSRVELLESRQAHAQPLQEEVSELRRQLGEVQRAHAALAEALADAQARGVPQEVLRTAVRAELGLPPVDTTDISRPSTPRLHGGRPHAAPSPGGSIMGDGLLHPHIEERLARVESVQAARDEEMRKWSNDHARCGDVARDDRAVE